MFETAMCLVSLVQVGQHGGTFAAKSSAMMPNVWAFRVAFKDDEYLPVPGSAN